jgi:AbrB family looped-hinge helix DNA binding protein
MKGLAGLLGINSITCMKVLVSKITTKGQATIPAEVRRALKVSAGEHVAFRLEDGNVTLTRARPVDLEYAHAVETTLASEWLAEEDEAAYGDL